MRRSRVNGARREPKLSTGGKSSTAPRAHAREALYALEDPAAGFVFDDFDRRYCEAERNRDLLWCDLPPHPLRLKAAHGLLMAEGQDVP